jgi:hypothetical protein
MCSPPSLTHSPVFRATAVTEELQNIADEQGTNVEKLVGLVKENQEILDMMKVSFITSNIGYSFDSFMTYQTSPSFALLVTDKSQT